MLAEARAKAQAATRARAAAPASSSSRRSMTPTGGDASPGATRKAADPEVNEKMLRRLDRFK